MAAARDRRGMNGKEAPPRFSGAASWFSARASPRRGGQPRVTRTQAPERVSDWATMNS